MIALCIRKGYKGLDEEGQKKFKKVFAPVGMVFLVGFISAIAVLLIPKEDKFVDIDSAKVGDTVCFGYYYRSNEWIVLDKKDDKLLMLSQEVQWTQCYDVTYKGKTRLKTERRMEMIPWIRSFCFR